MLNTPIKLNSKLLGALLNPSRLERQKLLSQLQFNGSTALPQVTPRYESVTWPGLIDASRIEDYRGAGEQN